MATTTVTIGVGSLAVAAAGAAVAGAVGLGLLGLAALGGGGGGGGRKKHGYGHQRYHREVEGSPSSSSNLQRTMEVIRRQDVTGCGLKFICDLAGEDPDDLVAEELALLSLVGPTVVPGEDVRGLGALGEYREAMTLGQNGGNCGESYFMCPLNGTQLMETVLDFLP